jgi:hypothetical protein
MLLSDNPVSKNVSQLITEDLDASTQYICFLIGFEMLQFNDSVLYDPSFSISVLFDTSAGSGTADEPLLPGSPPIARNSAVLPGDSVNIGLIVGIVVAVVAALLIAIVLVFVFVPAAREAFAPFRKRDRPTRAVSVLPDLDDDHGHTWTPARATQTN